MDEIIIERPEELDQHLCADRGYDYPSARNAITSRGYIPHIKRLGEEIQEK